MILVHGYTLGDDQGHDCNEYWGPAVDTFKQLLPATSTFLGARYYAADINCNANIDQIGTIDTPIEVLGRRLARYIGRKYSRYGVSVGLVCHAMGGHVCRFALSRFQAHDRTFPRQLLVHDAVTVSTGNAGDLLADECPWSYQCRELVPGSRFLAKLAPNPQGTGGTDWTTIESYCDPVVSTESAMASEAAHRIMYSDPCYGHVNSIQDTSTALDAAYDLSEQGGPLTPQTGVPHSLQLVGRALTSTDY